MTGPSTTRRTSHERGVSLIETMFATGILLTGIAGLLNLFTVAVARSKSQGEASYLATTYSQAKMEQLLGLSFNDAATDTTLQPPQPSGGTGLCGTMAANTTCGSVYPADPLAGYADYLDYRGRHVAGPSGASFVRQWSISTGTNPNLKTLTVSTTGPALQPGLQPYTVLISCKANF